MFSVMFSLAVAGRSPGKSDPYHFLTAGLPGRGADVALQSKAYRLPVSFSKVNACPSL
jgi:hypothetical protein